MRLSIRKAVLTGLALVAAAIAVWLLVTDLVSTSDTQAITRERVRRLAVFTARGELAGTPDLARLDARLAEKAMTQAAPILIRIFKREFELEVWKKSGDRFQHFATYPICNFSGDLGPKLREGDRQSPEGFYSVDAKALNPHSRWHKSFNLGFPNAFDRVHDRTGSLLMVHGGCSSIGCYAMTDPVIDEIWRLITASLKAGQPRFQVHVFPFRMTDANLAQRATSPWAAFWRDLKSGHDAFEATGLPPAVQVCAGRYAVAGGGRPVDRDQCRPVAGL